MTQLSAGPLGAYTPQAAAAIAAALTAAGLSTTGNVIYLDPVNGLDTFDGSTPARVGSTSQGPVQTLAAGYALLRSGYNDVLVLIGNGASSGSARLAAGFTWAKSAAHLIGICAPSAVSQRARIAPFTGAAQAAFANFFTITGSGCLFSNVSWFHGFTAGIAAAICVTITGSRNAFINCDFEGMGDAVSAADAGSRSLLISAGGQENFFSHCNIGLDTVSRTAANASIEIAGGGPRNIFENCTLPILSTDGLQYALIGAAAAALDRWVLFKGCNFISCVQSTGTAIAQLFKLAASVGGMLILDLTCGYYGVTAVGDATTKAQVYLSGVAATNAGGKGIVAT